MDESNSITNQKLILQRYADDHGFRNCKFYVDDGYSGTDFTRPAHVEMMQDVMEGRVGIVIVKDQSRLGRDHHETGRLMEIVFPSYNKIYRRDLQERTPKNFMRWQPNTVKPKQRNSIRWQNGRKAA